MAKQTAFITDKGKIKLGLVDNRDTPSGQGKFYLPPTDLRAFCGFNQNPIHKFESIPDHVPQDGKSVVAKLKNGNKLVMTSYQLNYWSGNMTYIMVEFYVSQKPNTSVKLNWEYWRKSEPNKYGLGGICEATKPEPNKEFGKMTPFPSNPYDWPKFQDPVKIDLVRDKKFFAEWVGDSIAPEFPGPDNEKDPEGGDGDGPDAVEDDPIEFPEKPGITVTDAGLMTLYTPTQGQIHAFGDFLWSDAFSLDTFKKLFADPMQAVIGLSIVPVSVPTAGAQPITIGAISSGVTANRAASQYVVHDCGTLKVNPVWNTALDFSPYTKFSIYLPFIGTRELKTDDIMGKELNVKYFVDVLSGACTAHISVGGSVLYQFSGSCATPVPLSAMNWNSTLTSMIQLAGAGIAMAVTGGAAAPAAAGMLTTATGMIGNKPNVQRSGAVSGAAGMLGVKTPYLIRETPRQSLAKDYAHYSGYPSNITAVLGTLKGFTMVENMHLKNIDATADELDEIETALKEGVIL